MIVTSHQELRVDYFNALSPSLSGLSGSGIGTWSSGFRRTGCRGIVGPVPPPLLMELPDTKGDFLSVNPELNRFSEKKGTDIGS
jgi:hypothetical protein